MEQLTKEQAIEFDERGAWKLTTTEKRALFQLMQDRLCMPFSEFHKAVGESLGRPVFSHEFANRDRLLAEIQGKAEAPSFAEILAMLPSEKTVVLVRQP